MSIVTEDSLQGTRPARIIDKAIHWPFKCPAGAKLLQLLYHCAYEFTLQATYIYIMYSIYFFIYTHYSTWCTYDLCLLLLSVTYVSMLRLFTTALEFSWLWDFSSAERLGFSRGWRRSRTDDTDAKDLDMALKWSSGDEDCFRAKKPGDLHRKNTQNDDRKSPLPRNNLWKKKNRVKRTCSEIACQVNKVTQAVDLNLISLLSNLTQY